MQQHFYHGYYPQYFSPRQSGNINQSIQNKKYNIKVEGVGKVKAKPDIASVVIGIETENEDVNIAQKENLVRANKVIKALKDMGIRDEDIQTVFYSVTEVYDYVDGKRVFKGYRVVNRFKVTVRDVQKVGEVIDTAINNGANSVSSVDFSLSNESIYYRKALVLAVKNAQEKAKDIGRSLGVKVCNTPTRIVEEKVNSAYIPREPAFRAPDMVTPIEPGEIEFKAEVVAEFIYA